MALELMHAENPDLLNHEQDDLAEGIDINNQSVTYVGNIQLTENEIINPFFVGLNGGNIRNYPLNTIWNYPHVLVLTIDSIPINFTVHQQLLKQTLNKHEILYFDTFFKCQQVSINILNTKYFYYRANIIEDKKISNPPSLNQSRQIIKLLDFFKNEDSYYLVFPHYNCQPARTIFNNFTLIEIKILFPS